MRCWWTVLLLLTAPICARSQTSSIIVEFIPNSPAYAEWQQKGRTGTVSAFTRLLGKHTSEPYIQEATLRCLEQAEQRSYAKRTQSVGTEQLSRYGVIHLAGPLNASLLAAKLRSLGLAGRAQVMPEQRIVGEPNDPEVYRQYYLTRIDAYRAWDVVPNGSVSIVAIIDTGIDTLHSDLQGSIWRNAGETGLDAGLRDRRSNGVDDDGNGFIDDWFGWDFVGVDGSKPDNAPLPGNPHGTHVGGIVAAQTNNNIGMAGVGRNVLVMPVKVGRDDPSSQTVSRSADGILYAAAMRADVINCSFGSNSPTFADVSVVQKATEMGCVIVGAAGNDASNQAFYPAAYSEAISVAATNNADLLATFSNYHSTVDVAAPGVGIFSTIPRNSYASYDGTSMAAPIVSAIAAMVRRCFPSYTPAQVRAAILAGCDNIDTLNPGYDGVIGTGRVNAFNSCSNRSSRWCIVSGSTLTDAFGNGVFLSADTVLLRLTLRNMLSDLADARLVIRPLDTLLRIIDAEVQLGAVPSQAERELPSPARLVIGSNVGQDARFSIRALVYDGSQLVGSETITAIANPTYATLEETDIAVTVNSSGNIGYNDYSSNEQGVGFRYKGSTSLLFEGALMLGTRADRVMNVARGFETSQKDVSFSPLRNAGLRSDSVVSGKRVTTAFNDSGDAAPLGLAITRNVYARTEDSLRNTVLAVLEITNTTSLAVKDIYAAYFFDFDIGANGANNVAAWDNETGSFFQYSLSNPLLPRVAITMISPLPINGFAVDNDGAPDCPSIYDAFTPSEKWSMMSQGLKRRFSTPTDASFVVGGGPFSIEPGASQQIAFILAAGTSNAQLRSALRAARNAASAQGVQVQPYTPLPYRDALLHVSGSPLLTPGPAEIVYSLTTPSNVVLDVIDITGRSVSTLYSENDVLGGDHTITVSIPEISQGAYFIRLTTIGSSTLFPVGVVR